MSPITIHSGLEEQVDSTTAGNQFAPHVEVLADGGWVVTWTRNTGTAAAFDIYQQRYNADGTKNGGEALVNTTTASYQYNSTATSLADGGWVVTWTSVLQDGDLEGIVQQRYNADGTKNGGEVLVNTTTAGTQDKATVTGLADGGWIVTWESYGQDGAPSSTLQSSIYQQRYNADGSPRNGETLVNTSLVEDQINARVTSLADGGWIVIWESNHNDSDYNLYLQRYRADGSKDGEETVVNSTTAGQQYDASVTALADGGWVVTWEGNGLGDASGIFQQRYKADGSKDGGETLVNITTADDQTEASVTALANGGWIVTWQSPGDEPGSFAGIYQQYYDKYGQPLLTSDMLVNATTVGEQSFPAVTVLGDGSWVVTWESHGQGGSSKIFQRHFSANFAPTDIALALDAPTVREFQTSPDVSVGTLSAVDEPGSSLTYTFTEALAGSNGTVSADGRFKIVVENNVVKLKANGYLLDYEQAKFHLVKIQVNDGLGGTRTEEFRIDVADWAIEKATASAGHDKIMGGKYADLISGANGFDKLYGNSGNDTLSGGAGNDKLFGGYGNDRLVGGTGKDYFVFTTPLSSRSNVDTIIDFTVADDTIFLENGIFTKLGAGTSAAPKAIASAWFRLGTVAQDANDYILYDRATGLLRYDADGSGAGAAIAFAKVTPGTALTVYDLMVI
jgi:Ca2+-binding RTX toxin-like protein